MADRDAPVCFHCGEPAPGGLRFSAVIDGVERPMCCTGCAAVARTIAGHGLTAYYRNRSASALRDAAAAPADEFAAYDLAAVQQPFVRAAGGGRRDATLLVEGVTCAACAWLIERGLARLAGVRSVAVNVAARRVQVEWDGALTRLSAILRAIAALGYRTRGFDPAASAAAAARERRGMLWRMFVAGFAMMQVMMYAAPAYVTNGELTREAEDLMRWASLTLTVPVMLWSAGPFFVSAWRDVRARRTGMDVPVALGLAVAFAASAWATVTGGGVVYFDSIAMFVFLLLGARYLEAAVRARATDSQRRLVGHAPAVADRLVWGTDAAAGSIERVAVAELVPGDRVMVVPGATIPADGTVIAGRSATDESLLTGEARTIARGPGDAVIGGSVNVLSPLTVAVTRIGADTVLAGIVRLLDRAQAGRPGIARLADRVAQWFVAALLLAACATGAAWLWLDPDRALTVVVAVLVVSCPCALSLATPAALAAATDALHRRGVVVTNGQALEALARVTHVVFDKTGTLTRGRLALTRVMPLGGRSRDEVLALAARLELGSEHPVARALRAAAGVTLPVEALAADNYPGRGVEAVVNGQRTRIGTPAFAVEMAGGVLPRELALADEEETVAVLADAEGCIAWFAFGDELRPGAHDLVDRLAARGLGRSLLSGDREPAVAWAARRLGIADAVGAARPETKLARVRRLQEHGAVVAMVGDGVNDAPVLAQAHVSIALAAATDLARANADVLLLGDDIGRLADALDTARGTMRVIRQNFAWAAAYNAIALPLAISGWITPLWAGIGMAGSSLAVVLNALRLGLPASGGVGAAGIDQRADGEHRTVSGALQRRHAA